MKGLSGVLEFIISTTLFVIVIFYTTINAQNVLPILHREAKTESLKSETWTVAQNLVTDEGWGQSSKNWDRNTVTRIGLSTGPRNVLSRQKIDELASLCSSNYNRLKSLLVGIHDIKIKISYLEGESVIDCGPSTDRNLKYSVNRFAILDTDKRMIKMEVTVTE